MKDNFMHLFKIIDLIRVIADFADGATLLNLIRVNSHCRLVVEKNQFVIYSYKYLKCQNYEWKLRIQYLENLTKYNVYCLISFVKPHPKYREQFHNQLLKFLKKNNCQFLDWIHEVSRKILRFDY